MRRFHMIRLLLLTLLLLAATTVSAMADTCALCGSETGSDDYLCTSCLLELIEGEEVVSPIEITRVRKEYNGNVTVFWTDSEGNAPYQVYYELLDSAPTPFGWTDGELVNGKRHTLTRLVPGVSYIITVADSKGNTAEYTYFAKEPELDREIGARIRLHTMYRWDYHYAQREDFSLSEILSENGTTHELYVRLNYSQLSYGRIYGFHLAMEAPNGFVDVIYSGTLELQPGRTYLPVWDAIPVDGYFDYLSRYYGGIPLGEYTVTLYFNGDEVYSDFFMMTE